MEYAIEKNIPIPANTRRVRVRYPFAVMSVSDSFAVTIDPDTNKNVQRVNNRLCMAVKKFCKGPYRGRFTVRVLRKEGEVRVWRVG